MERKRKEEEEVERSSGRNAHFGGIVQLACSPARSVARFWTGFLHGWSGLILRTSADLSWPCSRSFARFMALDLAVAVAASAGLLII